MVCVCVCVCVCMCRDVVGGICDGEWSRIRGLSLILHQSWHLRGLEGARRIHKCASGYEMVEEPASKSDPVTGPGEL